LLLALGFSLELLGLLILVEPVLVELVVVELVLLIVLVGGPLHRAEVLVVVLLIVVVLVLVELLVLVLERRSGLLDGGRNPPAAVAGLGLIDAEDRSGGEQLGRCGGGGAPVARADALRLGEQRGQRARKRVHLVRGQHGAVGEVRLVLGQQPLEAEQQRELAPPRGRGVL